MKLTARLTSVRAHIGIVFITVDDLRIWATKAADLARGDSKWLCTRVAVRSV